MDFKKPLHNLHYMDYDEPFQVRRKQILKAHPEIVDLYTPDPFSAYLALAIFIAQLTIAYYSQFMSCSAFLLCMYVFSATMNHTIFLLIHDLTHFTAFKDQTVNKLVAILANLVTGIPSAISFGKYHADHHRYLSVEEIDPDIPS